MNLAERTEVFAKLRIILMNLSLDELDDMAYLAASDNRWFVKKNIEQAITGIIHLLDPEKMTLWLRDYYFQSPIISKTVGLILAGNVPFVGFHDLMCTLISGHKAAVKLSSQDTYLMTWMIHQLYEIEPRLKSRIQVREQLKNIDAIIATGSDNTSRYFEFYFGKNPHIIRKNRTSVAILNGDETSEQLHQLGHDIFSYFGLGCRNVSKLLVTRDVNLSRLLDHWQPFDYLQDNFKYNNNYYYNKSILLVNGVAHLDNGFLLLRESEELISPISVLYHQQFINQQALAHYLEIHSEKIQCVVSSSINNNVVNFGNAQLPEICDYADHIDTLLFLNEL